MAGERTIRIKFDGTARGLKRAADAAARHVRGAQAKIAAQAGGFARVGQSIGGNLAQGVTSAFKVVPPHLLAAVAAAAPLVSAAIGGALAAGVLLGVGGGVLAAGIVAAAQSPQVKAAWTRFGDRAKKVFADFGKPFEGPMVRAAKTFGDALERMSPTLNRMGKSFAPIIDRLAPAFAGMAEKSLPGIERAMEASKPLFDKLAEHMPKIGEAVSKFLDEIAKGAPQATQFLDWVLSQLEAWLPIIGKVIVWLAKLFVAIDNGTRRAIAFFAGFAQKVLNFFGDILDGAVKAFGWMPGIGPKLKAAAKEFEKFRDKANAALANIQNRTVKITIEEHYKTFGKPGTDVYGIGGSDFKGRAVGGPVSAGRTYLVGERGPELLTMGANGRVTPTHELGGPQVLNLTLDLGHGIQQVVNINLREHDRGLKRRAGAHA